MPVARPGRRRVARVSLSQLLAILRAQIWSIVLMTLVSAGVAYGFARSLPKEYTAKARVLLDIGNSDPLQYSVVAPKTELDYIGTQMRLVGDIAVGRDVVEKLGWATDPAVIASWQAETDGSGDVTTWAARRILGNMYVRPFAESAILEIYYRAGSVDTAKQVAGLLRTAFIDNSQRIRAVAAQRASVWNRTQAAKNLAELNRAEAERVKFIQANNLALNGKGDTEVRELRQLSLRSARAGSQTTAAPQDTRMMGKLRVSLSQLDADIAYLLANGPNSPATLAALARREEIRGQLARETAFVGAGSNATAAAVAENARLVTEDYLRTRLALLDRAPLYDKLAQYDREIKLRTSLYLTAASRTKTLDMIAAIPPGVRVVGDVIADDTPSFPNVELVTSLAAALGLGLGVASALFGEMIARRIRGAEDLSFYSRVPVLAVIRGSRPRFAWRRMEMERAA